MVTLGIDAYDAWRVICKYSPQCSSHDYYDYSCDFCHCNHGPIYGHISSRPALNRNDESREIGPSRFSDQRNIHMHRRYSPIQYPNDKSMYQLVQQQNRCQEIQCLEDPHSEVSIFNPRSTIKLINGLKEWVACWLLGTTKRKDNKQIMFNGRSTVTSVIVSNSQHSKTGQRLSQFGDYTVVNHFVPLSRSANNPKESGNSVPRKRHRQKKRLAPPPPTSTDVSNKSPSIETKQVINRNKLDPNGIKPKKSPKKRRAPLPPISDHPQKVLDLHSTFLQQAEQSGVYSGNRVFHMSNFPDSSLQIHRKTGSSIARSNSDEDWEIVPKFEPLRDKPNLEFAEIDPTNLKVRKNDIEIISCSNDSTDLPDKQLTDSLNEFKKNDVHFKISIERREMNFVTVEELPNDDQSIVSDLSDDDEDIPQLQQLMLDDHKSSSSEETLPGDINPIFDDLQMAPPGKASVKDFVTAFNMLADREKTNVNTKNPPNFVATAKMNSTNKPAESVNNDKDGLSFPTKWQFQKNSLVTSSFPRNHSLVPIQEESHNDTSEVESTVRSRSPKAKAREAKQSFSTIFKEWEANNKKDKLVLCENGRNRSESLASNAAISALLKPDYLSASKGAKAKSFFSSKAAKTSSKQEQPIVVSLYIEDKSSHRGPIPFVVMPSLTLRKLKKKVEKEYNFDKDLQCWILGETFAIHDEATLASYGVDSGCPILLYVMSMESKTKSLPKPSKSQQHKTPIYDNVTVSSSDSDTEDVTKVLDREIGRNWKRSKSLALNEKMTGAKSKSEVQKPLTLMPIQSQYDHPALEHRNSPRKDYHALVELDDVDLVTNTEIFECPVCFLNVDTSQGAILQECLHSFCKECLAGAIEFSETAIIKCPFRNNEYSCESHLQEREVKALVSLEIFERHLQRSMALAESQAQDSFHCKTPDCPGWCLYEDNVNTFYCPVCHRTNCLTCNAIHEGRNCRQYQDHVATHCDCNEEAKKTKEYLEKMVADGEAMKCPKCEVILMKKWGCDWLKCSMCHTEVCWVTKGPRWGPAGRGDTSGGCKCMLNGIRCHPKCSYCH